MNFGDGMPDNEWFYDENWKYIPIKKTSCTGTLRKFYFKEHIEHIKYM